VFCFKQVKAVVDEQVPLIHLLMQLKDTLRERIQCYFGSELKNKSLPYGSIDTADSFTAARYAGLALASNSFHRF